LSSLLYWVCSLDVPTLVTGVATLAISSLVALLVPLRRALWITLAME